MKTRVSVWSVVPLVLALTSTVAGDTVYVDDDAPPGGDGSSWASALSSLTEAIDVGAGCDIRIAEGVYAGSFNLLDDTSLYGGYAGVGAPDPDARDVEAYPTVLSGALPDGGTAGTIVLAIGVTASVDGVTIRDGARGIATLASVFTVADSKLVSNVRGYIATGSNFTISSSLVEHNFRGGRHVAGGQAMLVDTVVKGNGSANTDAGGVHISEISSVLIKGCSFVENTSTIAGALRIYSVPWYTVQETEFHGNSAGYGVGGVFVDLSAGSFDRCTFTENVAHFFTSALVIYNTQSVPATIIDCTFARNQGVLFPCVGLASPDARVINCVFSRNQTDPFTYMEGPLFGETFAAAIYGSEPATIDCSTFSRNLGGALYAEAGGRLEVRNCLFWQNDPQHVDGAISIDGGSVLFSDDEPMFVQAGDDDLRLVEGSPAVDAGNGVLVPPGVVTDRAGNPRVQNFALDIGAYEGAYPPALITGATARDIDPYEQATIFPDGPGFFPLEATAVLVLNESGRYDQIAVAAPSTTAPLDTDAGYEVIESTLQLAATLAAGEFRSTVFVPFDPGAIGGADPLDVDLIRFDATTETWGLAVAANARPAERVRGTIGERYVVAQETAYGFQGTLGDYGVFTYGNRAFVWGVVDRPGSFAAGVARCRADNAQPPDGYVDWSDLLAVLTAWGRGPGPFDVDRDGIVGTGDLVQVLSRWGTCP